MLVAAPPGGPEWKQQTTDGRMVDWCRRRDLIGRISDHMTTPIETVAPPITRLRPDHQKKYK